MKLADCVSCCYQSAYSDLGAGVQAAAGSGGGGTNNSSAGSSAKDANHQLRNLAAHSSSSNATSSPSSALNLQTKEAKSKSSAGIFFCSCRHSTRQMTRDTPVVSPIVTRRH
jgi:hypothetical protein